MQQDALPQLASISPTSTVQFTPNVVITAQGSGFNTTSQINAGSTPLVTTFVDSTRLTATLPESLVASAGNLQISVVTTASTPSGGAPVSSGPSPFAVTAVSITPSAPTVLVDKVATFSAVLPAGGVTWSVNDIAGGNATVGTIDTNGAYLAPEVPPSPNQVTVSATSAVNAAAKVNATVAVVNPAPELSAATPGSAVQSQSTAIVVTGTGFARQSKISIGGTEVDTSFTSSTELGAVVPGELLATLGAKAVAVVTPVPGGGSTDSATLEVFAPGEVTASNHPQVARYSFTADRAGEVTVEFGPDTDYGLRTWSRPVPDGGGTVMILVAGMREFTEYHMRARVEFADGLVHFDQDQTFTTGGMDPARKPQITVTRPNPDLEPNPGIEIISGFSSDNPSTNISFITDLEGNIIWYYPGPTPPLLPIKLTPDGHIIMLFGTLQLRKVDLEGNIVAQTTVAEMNAKLAAKGLPQVYDAHHHDVIPLPNGHLIMLTLYSRVFTDVAGIPGDTTVQTDGVVTLDENLEPIWAWAGTDHLDVNRLVTPWRFPDWTHTNALAYSPEDGNLLLSVRHQNWVIKIDYQNGTGTGNIIWRLGHEGDFQLVNGGPADWFYAQHHPAFVGPGSPNPKIAVFDNGNFRRDDEGKICNVDEPQCFTRGVVYSLDEDAMTAEVTFEHLPGIFIGFIGSAQVLPNGNFEYNLGGGHAPRSPFPKTPRILEVTQEAVPRVAWQMDMSGFYSYRGLRIPSMYPGVQW